ncbi:MAG: toll/interleukin-1 receptor domain-containing protein [Chitinophagales bacterium]|nr:toll/interleukin-1 receptor domain-containing protein [Chitinophagales bacterium]
MLKIFVSHAWDDKVKDQFGQVYSELEQYDLWIDKSKLRPGENIREQIKKAINDCEVVLLLWSENAAASTDVQFEIETAIALNKHLLPCTINDYATDHSPHLAGRLYIDLRQTAEMPDAALGWMKVRVHLVDLYIEKMMARYKSSKVSEKLELLVHLDKLRVLQEEQEKRLSLLEDSLFRKQKGASNRNQNNAYIKNMVNSIIKDFSSEKATPEQKQVVDFLKFTTKLFNQLPDDDEATVTARNAKMREKIRQLDPQGSNALLGELAPKLM